MTPQANSSIAPEASSVPKDPETRRSTRISKLQKVDNPIDVCSSVCTVIILAHYKTLKVGLMPPPPPLVRAETALLRGQGKGKGKAKVQGGGDDKDDNGPSYKDNDDLSAQFIVQQAS